MNQEANQKIKSDMIDEREMS